MKKFLSIMLALVLVLSMGTVAFAANVNQDASFSKTYKITNEGTSNPAETFTFKFTADRVENSTQGIATDQMPAIVDSTVTFDAGIATVAGLEKTVDVALSNVKWPGVGVYYYTVKEVAGHTAGVTYDDAIAYLKVTVAYDEGTDTYYTAFVTLNLADEDEDGKTDVKTGGFTNVYNAGNLAITKNVTGNMGDKNAYFAVKVTLTGEEGKNYQNPYSVSGSTYERNPNSIKIGEETTFYLKHDETITIANLPYGVTYNVVENDYTTNANGGYDAATYTYTDDSKTINSASDTVTITNNKGLSVDTGVIVDSLPYVLMLAVVCAGLFVLVSKKRGAREN